MDFHSILVGRRTIHDFAPIPVSPGALERALEAALAAPNHHMTEPWCFVRAGARTRERLCEIAIALKSPAGAVPRRELVEKTRRKMLHPAELLIVARVRSEQAQVEREDYAAVACAIQNLSLSLWSEGIGSKWSTGAVTTARETYATLSMDPEEHEIVGFIWIGVAAKDTPKTRRRKTVADVFRELP
jgi:nitroreductase